MPEHKLCVPCLFGLEGPLGNELRHMGLRSVMPENGRVRCTGTDADIARMNLRCRFGERVLLELGSFPAPTFDALFEGVKALPWAQYLPADAAFPVKGYSLESALHSVPDCQKIIKKAVVESLKQRYHVTWFAETGALYQIQFSLVHDTATLYLDTTGTPLHKRGYRKNATLAPIKETLAAAIADLGRVRRDSLVQDPFCGSGTLVIEAAQKALNLAPGLRRRFAAEHFDFVPADIWAEQRQKALSEVRKDAAFEGIGYDIDPAAVALANANAKLAGVGDRCRFETADVKDFRALDSATVLTNPPYGERLGDASEAAGLAKTLGQVWQAHPAQGLYAITADADFEQHFGKKAARRRKIYNGMIPCQLYMYFEQPKRERK